MNDPSFMTKVNDMGDQCREDKFSGLVGGNLYDS